VENLRHFRDAKSESRVTAAPPQRRAKGQVGDQATNA
jgi:hypothetical protein